MPRTSILQNREAVLKASEEASIKDALSLLGLRAAGGNYSAFRAACLRFDISIPQVSGEFKTKGARLANSRSDDEVFAVDSTYSNRRSIKKKLRDRGMQWICSDCGLGEEWNGKAITLQLDHINGVYNDNRLENLRLLCPNCHSQTETFCGRNVICKPS